MNGPGISEAERGQRAAEGAAVTAASTPAGIAVPERVKLSNGIELKIRKVPPLLLTRAQEQIAVPKVPESYIEAKGETEENPNHPDYLKAVEEYNNAVNMAALNAMLLTGTSFADAPEGIDKPEDSGWAETLDALGIPVPTSTPGRYLAWLRYYALEDPMDMLEVMTAVGRVTGIAEADVLKAVEAFRSGEGRGATSRGPADEGAAHGDQLPADAGGTGPGD
jgi:hypothetical protein